MVGLREDPVQVPEAGCRDAEADPAAPLQDAVQPAEEDLQQRRPEEQVRPLSEAVGPTQTAVAAARSRLVAAAWRKDRDRREAAVWEPIPSAESARGLRPETALHFPSPLRPAPPGSPRPETAQEGALPHQKSGASGPLTWAAPETTAAAVPGTAPPGWTTSRRQERLRNTAFN